MGYQESDLRLQASEMCIHKHSWYCDFGKTFYNLYMMMIIIGMRKERVYFYEIKVREQMLLFETVSVRVVGTKTLRTCRSRKFMALGGTMLKRHRKKQRYRRSHFLVTLAF